MNQLLSCYITARWLDWHAVLAEWGFERSGMRKPMSVESGAQGKWEGRALPIQRLEPLYESIIKHPPGHLPITIPAINPHWPHVDTFPGDLSNMVVGMSLAPRSLTHPSPCLSQRPSSFHQNISQPLLKTHTDPFSKWTPTIYQKRPRPLIKGRLSKRPRAIYQCHFSFDKHC